jgi:acyl-CoA thioester hydrolase
MLETVRGSVQTWECDMNGHMNVQFYVRHAMDSLRVMGMTLGIGPAYQRDLGAGLLPVEHHIRYYREQHPGDPFRIQAGLLAVDMEHLHVVQEMRSIPDDALVATFVSQVQLKDLRSRDTIHLPPATLEKAAAYRAERSEQAAIRGVSSAKPRTKPTLAEAAELALKHTHSSIINHSEDDGFGHMSIQGFMARVSDAYPVLMASIPAFQHINEHGLGGAALEYRFIYHQVPQLNDIITIRSGVSAVASKTYNLCHWLFNAATKTCLATAEVVTVPLDLQTRRAVALPEADRLELSEHVIADFRL